MSPPAPATGAEASRRPGPSLLVFTDLDGTLLDRETYSFDAARPALAALAAHGVPLVLCTSKTRAEVAAIRARLGNRDPYIVENGGAVVVPVTAADAPPAGAVRDGDEWVVTLGAPRAELVAALRAASAETGVAVRGLSDMTAEELGALTGLPSGDAARALVRECSEPFRVLAGADDAPLRAALAARGCAVRAGGRLLHVSRGSDKGAAAARVTELQRARVGAVRTVALGDAPNDLPLLKAVDVPIIVRSPHAGELAAALPGAPVTDVEGPRGWNAAVLRLLAGAPSG